MLQTAAENIVAIIEDYQNDWDIYITPDSVLDWVNQFDNGDRLFILQEMEHIFQQTYFSKVKCVGLLKKYLPFLTKHHKYTDVHSFLKETIFLNLQREYKSQSELLMIVDEFLKSDYDFSLSQCGETKIKNFVYIDDVLATGNKAFFDLSNWLKEKNQVKLSQTNSEYIIENKILLSCCFLCIHDWGHSNFLFRLEKEFGLLLKKQTGSFYHYKIQNNLKAHNPSLNLIYPCEEMCDETIRNYLSTLDATANEDRAFRKNIIPRDENFFSSNANRIRLERIFLLKGIEILNSVHNLQVQNIRPLGYTVKSHKTLGLGTLFFTWRNIPNNCPLVFWWNNNGWMPLFNLRGRGH